ncbi:HAMP domain-containing sensor histidine kinase [Alkalihalobacterium bogoriense]|uniref:HAMP domain-containing sensor histidine kinase n=1 Tax=Alkalihalobacterium bogoriense TaxID=246272 RepID=UPI000688268C|nr:HAMP domain-containing sensor histidine kinase [Alkalihalobacterium bogoriense]
MNKMKQRLSTKITWIVVGLMFLVISIMTYASYMIAKELYSENVTENLTHRIITHAAVIENDFDLRAINHVLLMEQKQDVHLTLFDRELAVVVKSAHIEEGWIDVYRNWVRDQIQTQHEFPIVEEVDSGNFHIPHTWALQPIVVNGQAHGYLFIDQDTEPFEYTKYKLLILLLLMAAITFVIGLLLTLYITNKISQPLTEMGEVTHHIAKGDFDKILSIKQEDEVGQLAQDIQLMTKQLKEYRDSRQQFISNISHDLRTPITYIKGYSAILKDTNGLDEETKKRTLHVIYDEATRMEHLVSDLFQLTKLEEGQIQLKKEDTALIPWLMDMVASRQLLFKEKALQCTVNKKAKSIHVQLDQHRMGQAMINLLENSIRYTDPGGKIEIDVTENENHVMISVQDTGQGIPEQDLPFIWDRFYRVDKSRSSKSGGSGLGLAIVKQVVELHKGNIDVTSKEGVGTTFTLSLPKSEL